jgi:hypothetical protein
MPTARLAATIGGHDRIGHVEALQDDQADGIDDHQRQHRQQQAAKYGGQL